MDTKAFLEAVVSLIQKHQPLNGHDGLLAARLGYLLRSVGGMDWTEFGYPKLAAVLADLQAAGLVRVGSNSKGALAVWPALEVPLVKDRNLPPQPFSSHSPFRRLRTAAWHAFVLPPRTASERRFIHRQNGFVRSADSLEPGEMAQWVQVDAIPVEEQRAWAVELLTDLRLDDDADLQTVLKQPDWHLSFRDALKARDPVFASRWNRIRSSRVQSHVEAWCERNSVPHEVVFQPYRFPRVDAPAANEPPRIRETPRTDDGQRPSELRALLLEALGRMPTDELLTLDIPPRYVLAAARPGLVRE